MNKVIKGRVYKHFKGDSYIVIDIATNSETMEKMVIYRGLYDDGPLWVRPYDNFIEEVNHEKYKNVSQKYKFELQDIKSNRS